MHEWMNVLHLLNVYYYWNFLRHKKNYFPLLHCIFSYRFYLRACFLPASLPITELLPSINLSSALLKLSTLRKLWIWRIASLFHAKVGSLLSTGYLPLCACKGNSCIYLYLGPAQLLNPSGLFLLSKESHLHWNLFYIDSHITLPHILFLDFAE